MSKSEAQVLDFEKICRLCLLEKRSMSSIFSKKKSDKKVPLPVRIMSCASLELYEGDGLPSSICSKCLLSVNQSYAFREQCEQADTTLRQYARKLNEANEEASLKNLFFNKLERQEGINKYENGSRKYCQNAENMEEKHGKQPMTRVPMIKVLFYGSEGSSVLSDVSSRKNAGENDDGIEENKNLSPSFMRKNCKAICGLLTNSEKGKGENKATPEVRVFVSSSNEYGGVNISPGTGLLKVTDVGEKRPMELRKPRRSRSAVNGEKTLPEHRKGYTTAQFFLEYAAEMEDHSSEQNSLKSETVYCKACKIFIGRPYFYNHVKFVHKNIRNHLCQECGYRAHTHHALTLHVEAKHSGLVLPCKICGMTFGSRKQLRFHVTKRHSSGSTEIKQVCQYCGKTFTLFGYLKDHIRVHTKEAPYGCQFCKRRFKSKWACKTHENVHTGVKPYKCTYCMKAFTQNCTRKAHEYRIHGNEAFRPKKIPKEENGANKLFTVIASPPEKYGD